jgi:hypothetical protein
MVFLPLQKRRLTCKINVFRSPFFAKNYVTIKWQECSVTQGLGQVFAGLKTHL